VPVKTLLAFLTLCSSLLFAGDLQSQLDRMAAAHKGKVGLFAKNLRTGATVAINADAEVQTASVIKLAIMLETFCQVEAGKHRLDERLTLTKENQVPGSGVLTLMQPGLQPSLLDAVTLMIDISDNTATNLVLDDMGIPAVNERLQVMGLKRTHLFRKVFMPYSGPVADQDRKFGLGRTTPREMAVVMESVWRCDLGDKRLCSQMLSILHNQFYRESIPRYLEEIDSSEGESTIGNKSGAVDGVRNDVALIETNEGPIVISVFTWDNQDNSWTVDNTAELLIAHIARKSWMHGHQPQSPKKPKNSNAKMRRSVHTWPSWGARSYSDLLEVLEQSERPRCLCNWYS
jgi:beta-lactamase class A